MNMGMGEGFAALGLVWMLFVGLLAILWVLVPFAIFGIKPLLRELIREQKATQALLTTISQQVYPLSVEASKQHGPAFETLPPA
ncbi:MULTISPECIES: hypothetical protein [Luteimonas]|uniref:Uncharacterized protein n=1 Tax=Luteimonas chenhongjianii TaxID=2006110 RepID=A0A290XCE5_9GAMM|nr:MULTISPECIES: hypothetical protein [Luteimonas]ATD66834.1 hypothetical protein CNR27_04700 [Luteimonas chenhongjianii]RPD84575.1 hypothetical protein EGK76_12745 [Luteimonas sp. 100069]